jgi:hypothetical protein
VIKKQIKYIILILVLVSCQSESKSENKSAKEKKTLSEKTDLRQELNGYWILISQSFTKGRKLEKFPVGGSVSMIIDEFDNWYTLRRVLHENEDTISRGTLTLVEDKIVFEVTESKDEASYIKLEGKVEVHGRFMQIEGTMSYKEGRKPEYTHTMFGKSERTMEEIFD